MRDTGEDNFLQICKYNNLNVWRSKMLDDIPTERGATIQTSPEALPRKHKSMKYPHALCLYEIIPHAQFFSTSRLPAAALLHLINPL